MTRPLSMGAVVALATLLPGVAAAEDTRLIFEWQAPAGCPQRDAVLARAGELLGRAPDDSLEARLELRALVSQPAGSAWQLTLSSRTSSGEPSARRVSAASCRELADAAALLLALAIDPALVTEDAKASELPFEPAGEAVAAPPATQPPVTAPVTSDHPPPPAEAAGSRASERASSSIRLRAGAALAIWSRRLPGTAAGALATAGIGQGGWWVLLNVGFFPARQASVAGSSAGGNLSLLSVGPELGYAITVGRVEALPLVSLDLEWLRGSGRGVEYPNDAELLLVSLGGGARAGVRLSPSFALFGQGLVSTLARRPRFVLDGIGPVYQPQAWGLRFSLGAEWQTP